jgi:hypothetical protein
MDIENPFTDQPARANEVKNFAANSADQASGKSALEQREHELLQAILEEKKGETADGQKMSNVRQAVEGDLGVTTRVDQ